jgi:hypothetical protein
MHGQQNVKCKKQTNEFTYAHKFYQFCVIWNDGTRILICPFNFPATVFYMGKCCSM